MWSAILIRVFGVVLVWTGVLPSLCGVWPASTPVELFALCALPLLSLCWLLLPAKRIDALSRISVVVAAVSITIVLTELACRLFLGNFIFARTNEQFVRRLPANPELRRYIPGLRVRAAVVGDLGALSDRVSDREQREELLMTDEYGFRNQPGTSPEKEVELLFLGDSITAGVGTSQEQTFASLVPRRTGLRAYNLAMTMSTATHQLINLELETGRMKLAPRARLILVTFGANDLFEASRTTDELRAATLSDPFEMRLVYFQDFRKRSPLRRILGIFARSFSQPSPQVMPRELASGRRILFFRPYVERSNHSSEAISQTPEWRNFVEAVQAIDAFCDAKGLKLQVLLAPSKEEIYRWAVDQAPPWNEEYRPSGFTRLLAEACKLNQIDCHDTGPEMFERARWWHQQRNVLLWWHDDTHFNPDGHRAFADIITARLRATLLD